VSADAPSGTARTAALPWLDRAVSVLSTAGAVVAALAVVIIMVVTSYDALRRKLTGESIEGVTDWVEVLLVLVAFLGLSQGERVGAHVSTGIVVDLLPRQVGVVLQWIGRLVYLAVVLWLLEACYDRASQSVAIREYSFGLAQVPIWPARVAIVVGYAVLVLEIARGIVAAIAAVLRGHRAPTPTPEHQPTVLEEAV
jgi:TRAP-type mannitol/chloroaromatic compound transport system permease small subunit